jgi:hypothetical protein
MTPRPKAILDPIPTIDDDQPSSSAVSPGGPVRLAPTLESLAPAVKPTYRRVDQTLFISSRVLGRQEVAGLHQNAEGDDVEAARPVPAPGILLEEPAAPKLSRWRRFREKYPHGFYALMLFLGLCGLFGVIAISLGIAASGSSD